MSDFLDPALPQDSQAPGDSAMARRSFLTRSLAAGAVVAPVLLMPNTISAAEREEREATRGTIPISAYLFPFKSLLSSIRKHENDHVAFLKSALGSAARPKPTFQNLDPDTYGAFLRQTQVFENTGTGAYLGAAPAILDRNKLAAAGTIATIEARQAGAVNIGLGDPVSPGDTSFEQPLTAAEVNTRVSPFIANLNGGPPLTYSTTPSAANDIAILNFALALEFLEQEFYNLNASRFGYA